MGSSGRASTSTSGGDNGAVSDVRTKTTPMSDEDKEIVAPSDWLSSGGYFQTSNSFRINDKLRKAAMGGDQSILQDPVVQAMDRNMSPVNADFKAVRMVDDRWFDSLMKQAGMTEFSRSSIMRMSDDQFNWFKSQLVGGSFNENAYASMSYNIRDNVFTHRTVQAEVTVKQGTHGMFSPTGEEAEFVLSRTSGYAIKDITRKGGKLHFELETKN